MANPYRDWTGAINVAEIDATGTPSSFTALFGDGTWKTASSGGAVHGVGTAGTIAKWSTTNTITDSLITETGSTVTVSARTIISGALQSSASSLVSLSVSGGSTVGTLQAGASTLGSLSIAGGTTLGTLQAGASTVGTLQAGASTYTSLSVSGGSTLGTLQAGNSTLTALSAGASTVASLVVAGTLQSSATTVGTLSAGASTLTSLIVSGSLQSSATTVVTLSAGASTLTSLVVSNGITAGSGVVGIVDGTGKIPALSGTYFASLSAVNLTSLPAANLLIASQAVGDLLYASSASAWARLADVAVNQVLVSGGVGVAPAYSGTPTVTGLTATGVAALTTAAESWIGPSSTTGIYFKSGNAGFGTITPGYSQDVKSPNTITQDYVGLRILNSNPDGAVTTSSGLILSATNSMGQIHAKIAAVEFGSTDASDAALVLYSGLGVGVAPAARVSVSHLGLRLMGSTSGYVGFFPQANAGSTTYTLPTADGTNDQVWTTNGSGGISWTAKAGGGGTGITTLNSQTGATQTFTNDTNITIASAGNAHALGFAGQLAVARGGTGLATLTANRIPYGNGTSAFQSSSNLLFDGTNLGVGGSPTARIHVTAGDDATVFKASGGVVQTVDLMTSDVQFRLGALTVENDPKIFWYSGNPGAVVDISSPGTISQALYVVTGVGTAFTAALIGTSVLYADLTDGGWVTGVASATSMTVTKSQTVGSQDYTFVVGAGNWDNAITSVGRTYTGQNEGHLRVRSSLLEVATDSSAAGVHRGLRLRAGASPNRWAALIAYDRTNNQIEFGVDNAEIVFDEKVRLIIAAANFAAGGTVYIAPDGKTLTTTAPSDRRYKTKVRKAALNADRIFNLTLQDFDWKSTGEPDVGFMADDIQQNLPELYRDGEDGPKINGEPIAAGWKADRFPFYLFEALATLKARVDRVERRP